MKPFCALQESKEMILFHPVPWGVLLQETPAGACKNPMKLGKLIACYCLYSAHTVVSCSSAQKMVSLDTWVNSSGLVDSRLDAAFPCECDARWRNNLAGRVSGQQHCFDAAFPCGLRARWQRRSRCRRSSQSIKLKSVTWLFWGEQMLNQLHPFTCRTTLVLSSM